MLVDISEGEGLLVYAVDTGQHVGQPTPGLRKLAAHEGESLPIASHEFHRCDMSIRDYLDPSFDWETT